MLRGGWTNDSGKIDTAQGRGPAVGGFSLDYLPVVLGGEVAGRKVADGELTDFGCFGGGDGG